MILFTSLQNRSLVPCIICKYLFTFVLFLLIVPLLRILAEEGWYWHNQQYFIFALRNGLNLECKHYNSETLFSIKFNNNVQILLYSTVGLALFYCYFIISVSQIQTICTLAFQSRVIIQPSTRKQRKQQQKYFFSLNPPFFLQREKVFLLLTQFSC